MSGAREEVLARIRTALGPRPDDDAPAAPPPPVVPPVAAGPPERLVALFVERVEDYRAVVTVVDDDAVPDAVAAICARHAVSRLAVPDGVPGGWLPAGIEVLRVDVVDAAAVRALDAVDGVLTTCALAVAETGTIVLDSGHGQGPRAATLLPDLHVCVVAASTVVAGVAEMTAAMGAAVRDHGRPLTMISGPSATSDIELDRVEGVHGPRRLEVIVARTPG